MMFNVKKIVVSIFVSIAIGLYLWSSLLHSNTVNVHLERADQGKYLSIVKTIHENNYWNLGDRNRTPLYPYLQSIFYTPSLSDAEAFVQGKTLNAVFSIVLLGIIYHVCSLHLRKTSSLALLMISAFSLFVVRAGYYQVELLYFSLSFFSFISLVKCIQTPSYKRAFFTGLLVAITYYAKASILLAVYLFIFFKLLQIAIARIKQSRKRFKLHISSLVIFVSMFLIVLSPYLIENKMIYGKYFYNVNTTFYIWYDSYQEIQQGTQKYGDTLHWPNMPESELPSASKYFREHSLNQMLYREINGLLWLIPVAIATSTAYLYLAFYSLFVIPTIMMERKPITNYFKNNIQKVLYVVSFLGVYTLAYAWYQNVEIGSRFILSLVLPALFSLLYFLQQSKILIKKHKKMWNLSYLDVLNLLIIAVVTVDFFTITGTILREVQQ